MMQEKRRNERRQIRRPTFCLSIWKMKSAGGLMNFPSIAGLHQGTKLRTGCKPKAKCCSVTVSRARRIPGVVGWRSTIRAERYARLADPLDFPADAEPRFLRD